jgi:hypothetical protein
MKNILKITTLIGIATVGYYAWKNKKIIEKKTIQSKNKIKDFFNIQINTKLFNSNTIKAIKEGNFELVRYYIQKNPEELYLYDKEKFNLLFYSLIYHKKNKLIFPYLLENNAEIDKKLSFDFLNILLKLKQNSLAINNGILSKMVFDFNGAEFEKVTFLDIFHDPKNKETITEEEIDKMFEILYSTHEIEKINTWELFSIEEITEIKKYLKTKINNENMYEYIY